MSNFTLKLAMFAPMFAYPPIDLTAVDKDTRKGG